MNILFPTRGWEDYVHWQLTDKKLLKKIYELLKDIAGDSNSGIGRPEPLQYALIGYWSRGTTEEHRLVYKVDGDTIKLGQARYHYE